MAKCCAPNCSNSQRKDSLDYSFHGFPQDQALRTRWIANIGRPNWTPGRRSLICSAHFDKSQFKRIDCQNQLRDGAEPTLFPSTRSRKGQSLKYAVDIPKTLVTDVKKSKDSTPQQNYSINPEGVKIQLEKQEEKKSSNVFQELTRHQKSGHGSKQTPHKFIGEFTFNVEDCEIFKNLQSNKLAHCKKTVDVTEFHECSEASGGAIKPDEENSTNQEDVVIVDSAITSTHSEMLVLPKNYHPETDCAILIQPATEEPGMVYKQALNLSRIANPSSSASLSVSSSGTHFKCASDSTREPLDTSPPPSKRCKLSATQGEIFVVENPSQILVEEHAEASLGDASDDTVSEELRGFSHGYLPYSPSESPNELEKKPIMDVSTPVLPIKKGFIDLPVSLVNHEPGKRRREQGHSSSTWQHGTFMCRLCGVASNKTLDLFGIEASELKLMERISSILPILIAPSDSLPQSVCSKCLNQLDVCSELIVSSFNTQTQLASVMNQDVRQLSQLPLFFQVNDKKAHNPDKERHVLVLEMYHEKGKPVQEYFSIAYNDLHLRLHPEEIESEEMQCNLVLAAITDDSSVSQLEQVRAAAEALICNALIQEEQIVKTKPVSHGSTGFVKNFHESISLSSDDRSTCKQLPQVEPQENDDQYSSEVQVMPVVDNTSPSDFDPAFVRCSKMAEEQSGLMISFNDMQNAVYWQMSKDGEVRLACGLCETIFERQNDIKNHLAGHLNFQSNVEEDFGTTLPWKTSHKMWKSVRGKQFQSYKCSFCALHFSSKLVLKQHVEQQHVEQQHATNAKCEFGEATVHLQTYGKEQDWRCKKCPENFPAQKDLQRHQETCAADVDVPSWLCDVCGKSFSQAAKLNQHKRSHLPPEFKYIYECSQCPKRYISSSRLKEHKLIHEDKRYMCKVCGKLFSTKQILRQHEFTHSDPQFLCSLCSRTFFRKSHLLKHMNVHNPENARASRLGIQPHRDGLNRCRECKVVLDSKELLAHYKETHPNISLENYVCEICAEENTSYAELFQHQREIHRSGVKDCPFCEKTIDSSTMMKYHLMRHEGMFPYNCPLCSNGYIANSVLQDHIRRKHTGEKPFECQQCLKCFPTSGALAQHTTVHSLPHELLPCPVCNQGFKRKAHLDIHLRTHTGEKPYPCPICDRPFRQRPDCLKHIRVIHGEDPSKFDIKFHPNLCVPFPQVVADMELVLEGEDLMQAALGDNQVYISQ